jgi:hypothetical protein
MSTVIRILAGLVLIIGSGVASAQPAEGGDAAGGPDAAAGGKDGSPAFEAGVHVGKLLPNQIDGVTEIMGLGGVRMALRLNPGSYVEGGIMMGNGEGQQWKNSHISLRMDIPIEKLVAIAYVGADNYYYKGPGTGQKLVFGGHAGGGFMAQLAGSMWFRTDMKFSFNPGTSLYFGFGLAWRI